MMLGPIIESTATIKTTIMPNTARRFFNSLRQASFHKEVPATNSPASAERTSASPIASSKAVWIVSPSRERIGACGEVPSGVSAGSTGSISCDVELSSVISLIANARIEKSVGDIDQQIHQQQRHRDKGYDADNQWFISIQCSLNEIISEPRKG